MISYIKHQHRNLSTNEFINIRLIEDIEIIITKNDTLAGDRNTLLIIKENGNIIMINLEKIIMCQKREMR